jgi:hypothetical protein
MAITTAASDALVRRWPLAVLFAAVALLVAACLVATGGHPTYLLDDAWIHLQFSEQIVAGHFGLVTGEQASPSSSILYPLLLIPLAATMLHQWLPAVWNLVALIAVLLLWQRLFGRFVLTGIDGRQRDILSGSLALVATILSSTLFLALSGMEHTLQIAATLAVAVGLLELLVEGKARWWLLAGLIAGPLLRLENFSVTLPAVVCLLCYGHWRIALAALAGSIGGVVAHGLLSLAHDLPFLGAPLLLKGWLDDLAQTPLASLRLQAEVLARSLRSGRPDTGALVVTALLAVGAVWRWRGGDRVSAWLAVIAIASLMAQFLVGGFRAGRYEIYSQCLGLAALAYVARQPLQQAARTLGTALSIVALVGLLVALFPANLVWTATAPWAAQDIWRQHWQMRRFLIEQVKAPAAVNDVGLTAYRNPYPVLDLVGLGSEEIRRARVAGRADRAFYASVLEKHRIEAVLIYNAWFADLLPAGFERVAEFHLGRAPAIAGAPLVTVYAASPQIAARLRQAASAFAPSMPPGSVLIVVPQR